MKSFSHQALKPFLDRFRHKTGITVRLQGGPATGQDLLLQIIPALNAGTPPYDVMGVGDHGCAALTRSGRLTPPDDVLENAFWTDLTPGMADAMKTWNQRAGKTYRIHHNREIGCYWTRGDVLAKNHLKVPASWDEVVSIHLAYPAAQAGGRICSFDAGTRRASQVRARRRDPRGGPRLDPGGPRSASTTVRTG